MQPFPTTTAVFDWNFNSKATLNINQGGTSSGKTYSILQVLSLRAATESNVVVTVVGGDVPDLKSGAFRDFQSVYSQSEFLQKKVIKIVNSERLVYFDNGSLIEFKSYEKELDARSGKRSYLFINEAQNVKSEVYEQLSIRTSRQIFIDYNPSTRFWAHDLIGQKDTQLFISNFTHNPFCPEKIQRKILDYRVKNPMRWRVYGLGLTGQTEGVIFPNCFSCLEFPKNADVLYGLDWGYAADPCALVRVAVIGQKLYGEQLIYERGMSNAQLKRRLEKLGITGNDLIIADSAEPKSIDALRDEGYWIEPAVKGADSVAFGIDTIHGYDEGIHLTAASTDWWVEQENYVFTTKNGKKMNKPIDGFNHCWDAFRYAVTHMATRGRGGLIASG